MSIATAPSASPSARQTPMSHAFALLLEEREVLVEHALADGTVIREAARLGGGAAEAPLPLTPDGRRHRWAELEDGTPVVLIVPVMHRRWRFVTSVLRAPGGADAALAWPSEIEQVIGRVAARATLALAVEVREVATMGEFPPRPVCTYTLDVSMSGVQLVLPTLHPRGTRLSLTFRLPRGRRAVSAEVMWASAADEPQDPLHRTGVGFEKPSPLFTHELRELLSAAAPSTRGSGARAG